MKSDEKVIEEFSELLDVFIEGFFENIGKDRLTSTLRAVRDTKLLKDFILKTRREAVEEAFRTIEIDLLGDGDHSEYELGHDNAIDEINRKKEEFLREK